VTVDTKRKIEDSLKEFSSGKLRENAIALFNTLGYKTSRQAALDNPDFTSFKSSYIDNQGIPFREDKALTDDWLYIDLLFQISKEEATQLTSLFNTKKVDDTVIESYLFFAIELSGGSYTRTALSNITREINRVFPMPVMVLFKHCDTLTLSIINRRLHKRDETKDVLEKVTLIKDISVTNPHRAHIEILYDLSFDELYRQHQFSNFVELHNAWQKTLDTKELNKRFYNDLANWYFWALDNVKFPKDAPKDKDGKHPVSLIRLITRIIFVWFIKEKDLIPDVLFSERDLHSILNGFNPQSGNDKKSVFYRAILQNLFFATLNTEMKDRSWARDGQNMMAHSLYRFKDCFTDSEKALELFSSIPFLNGGLFECLDKTLGTKEKPEYIRIDGFSRRTDSQPTVPDYLFFGNERTVDLTGAYGDKKHKSVKVQGLINILSHYKFTVTENTPIEEEIALDPELLGRVFENLLANYNPETKTTARKQTGSFYTPREIVNYMVDESLKAYLKQKLVNEAKMDEEDADIGLEFLVSYNEKENLFDEKQTHVLINAIDNCKILDPACGSGAFPMGILHKMVHILHRIDPRNAKWKQRQIEKAEAIDHQESRENAVTTLEDAFENNELDFPRKLYLIENCIYGVDIQPIAVQIAKLRFFISLIVDQKVNKVKENLGVLPLPNLETKFVAANTLIGIQTTDENMDWFENEDVQRLQKQLQKIRHRMFSARTPKTKRNLREKDESIRKEMADRLEEILNGEISSTLSNRKESSEVEYLESVLKKKRERKDESKSDKVKKEIEKIEKDINRRRKFLQDLREKFESRNNKTAQQLAAWNPYDQNANASFFDPEWMFGLDSCFDISIGNPPYLIVKNTNTEQDVLNVYLKYFSADFKVNLFALFIEKSKLLGNSNSVHTYIIPDTSLNLPAFRKLRELILTNGSILSISYFDEIIFESASVGKSVVLSLSNNDRVKLLSYKYFNTINDCEITETNKESILRDNELKLVHASTKSSHAKLMDNLKSISMKLRDVCSTYDGINPGSKKLKNTFISKSYIDDFSQKIIDGKAFHKYTGVSWNGDYIYYNEEFVNEIREELNQEQIPFTARIIKKVNFFEDEKIITRQTADTIIGTIDLENFYVKNSVHSTLLRPEFKGKCSLKRVLSVLNSKLISWYYQKSSMESGRLFPQVKIERLRNLPFILPTAHVFDTIVDYLLFLGFNEELDHLNLYYSSLIDVMVYEIYFPDQINAARCEVLKHLNNLPELNDDLSAEEKIAIIHKVYKKLSDPKHPVSIATFKMQEIEEIRIIEGKA